MISIIIPVLNEASFIGRLLTYLTENSSVDYISEIIVVDGGSTDATLAIVKNFDPVNKHSITLLKTDTGRAKQMNVGAKKASGSILYFLHADSLPPIGFDALIVYEVKKSNEAGCFRIQFDSSHWWLNLAGWFTQFNWSICRGGDQSLFITKSLFNTLGGYDEDYLIYEDQILIHALYSRKQFVVIDKKLQTSARMYRKHGIFRLQYFYWCIYLKRWLGADANALYKYYKKWVA